jgi:hypothetical protein
MIEARCPLYSPQHPKAPPGNPFNHSDIHWEMSEYQESRTPKFSLTIGGDAHANRLDSCLCIIWVKSQCIWLDCEHLWMA